MSAKRPNPFGISSTAKQHKIKPKTFFAGHRTKKLKIVKMRLKKYSNKKQ